LRARTEIGVRPRSRSDIGDTCLASNYNLEFKIQRRLGHPAVGGTAISASCSLADFAEVSCPGIGGN
jgi:hypothetical protein